ncbi:MAG: glycoside hydrolase family 43 protein [Muribaculaceae bacterium]|nr:glycoside hydrolase family 43 protein [Muribaculaceae bacterium]
MVEYYGYVYAYFRWRGVAKDMQYIYLALSRDGLHFTPLNCNEPILIPDKGTKAARDPHLIRSRIDGKYYIIATDLDVNQNKWREYKLHGSKSVHVWESTDMVHWSEDSLRQVIDDSLGCIWAPKVCFDEEKEDYVMAFSAAAAGETDMSVYYTRTKDFRNFTKAKILVSKKLNLEKQKWAWFVPPKKYCSFIDSTTVKVGDTYYRFTKNDTLHTIMCEKSASIVEGYSLVKEIVAGEHGVEGPCVYKLNQSENYILLMDGYASPNAGVGYFPLISSTENMILADFYRLPPQEYYLPEGCKHGSVLPVTKDEYERLEAAFERD